MEIHPRPFAQVLGDAMGTLGKSWKSLVSPALVAFVPAGILTFVVYQRTGAQEILELLLTDPQAIPPGQLWVRARPLLEALGWALVIQLLATVYVYLASHRVAAAAMAGEHIGPAQARRHASRGWISGLVALAIAGVGVLALLAAGIALWSLSLVLMDAPGVGSVFVAMVLFLVLITPAAWLAVSVSMTTAVISVEGTGPLRALRRSVFLVRGRALSTLGYLLLVGLLGAVAVQLIQMVAIPLVNIGTGSPGFQIAAVVGVVFQGMIVAAMAAMYTGWYVDLRSRKETLFSDSLLSDGR